MVVEVMVVMVEVAEVAVIVLMELMAELMVVVDIRAWFLILVRMLPKLSSGHDVCCHFLVNILFHVKEIHYFLFLDCQDFALQICTEV